MAGEFESQIEIDAVEIYQFTYGDSIERYTSNFDDVPVTCSADFAHVGTPEKLTFFAETIKRSEVTMSGEMNKSVIQLQTIKNNKIAGYFISGTPLYPINVKIWRMSEFGLGLDKLVIFQGRVTGCSMSGLEATLNCEPMFTQLQKAGLRRMYEPRCSHVLYDPATCKRNPKGTVEVPRKLVSAAIPHQDAVYSEPDDNGQTTLLTPEVAGVPEVYADAVMKGSLAITLSDGFSFTNEGAISITNPLFTNVNYPVEHRMANGLIDYAYVDPSSKEVVSAYFTGGILELYIKGQPTCSKHMIAQHTTGLLTLVRPITKAEWFNFDHIVLLPGCDHVASTCCKKFHNTVNFGGFPYMSSANPFAGTHVPPGA